MRISDLEDGKLTNRLLSQESGVYEQTHQSSGVLKEVENLRKFETSVFFLLNLSVKKGFPGIYIYIFFV